MLEARELPAFMDYGAYVGEVAAPLLILAGVLTRLSSLAVAGTEGHGRGFIGTAGDGPLRPP
jgi:hypothetical protein